MKKIININLSSRLIPIEDSAYELLKNYIDSLKKYFAREEGRDEIINDIENRIAEIFQDKLKKGAHCITDDDVNAVIASMGRPEQFDEAGTESRQSSSSQSSYDYADFVKPRKRLYRDPDDKILGGVCSGLGAYFDVDPIIFRLIFALLLFGAGTGILLYIILWIATPEAKSAAEKLEMRGERVDLHNISNAVKEEMENIKGRMENIGDDIRNFSRGRGREIGSDIGNVFGNIIRGLANILVVLTKGFFYFLAVVILIALIVVAIALVFSSAALFPLKDLIFYGFWQNFLFWPALVLLIGIPIVGIIIFIIRKLSGVKYANRYVSTTLSFLWAMGIVCLFIIIPLVARDFNMSYRQTNNFELSQPASGNLIIMPTTGDAIFSSDNDIIEGLHWFGSDLGFFDDTVYIKNVRIKIGKSQDDNFHVQVEKISNGHSVAQAADFANNIMLDIYQQDSILYIDPYLKLAPGSKFRNQHVIVFVYVPVHKQYSIERDDYSNVDMNDGYNYWDDNNTQQYQMTPSGPQPSGESKKDTTQQSLPPADSSHQNKSGKYHYQEKISVSPDNNTTSGTIDELSYLFYALFNLSKN